MKTNLTKLMKKQLQEFEEKFRVSSHPTVKGKFFLYDAQEIIDFLSTCQRQIIEAIKEEVEGMKNHNEMLEMAGKKYTEGFEKALSDLQSKLKIE